jgi:hypothetical protein
MFFRTKGVNREGRAAALSVINLPTPPCSSATRIRYEAQGNILPRLEAETSNLDRSAADVEASQTSQVQLVPSCDLALLHTPFAPLRTEDAD